MDTSQRDADHESSNKKGNTYESANLLSRLTFWWVNPFYKKGYDGKLSHEDLPAISEDSDCEHCTDILQRYWTEEVDKKKGKQPNLVRAVLRSIWIEMLLPVFLFVIPESQNILQPYFIGQLLGYLNSENTEGIEEAMIYAIGLGLSALTFALTNSFVFYQISRISIRLRASLSGLVYRKILRMNSKSIQSVSSGQIINLLSADIERWQSCLNIWPYLIWIPMEIAMVFYLLYQNCGVAGLFPLGALLVLIPISALCNNFYRQFRSVMAGWTDRRIIVMNEIITGIKLVKMHCWERALGKIVHLIRRKELNVLRKTMVVLGASRSLFTLSAKITIASIFIGQWALGIIAQPYTVYTSMGWLYIMTANVGLIFLVHNRELSEANVSAKRLTAFLLTPEESNDPDSYNVGLNEETQFSVNLVNIHTTWASTAVGGGSQSEGELIAVIGSVGSGKSSLLLTILGELPVDHGNVYISGKLGFAPQLPWVFNGTVRENVLVGEHYDEQLYSDALEACALRHDIESLPHRDLSLVGEKGLMLSGGQKTRVSLARTVSRLEEEDIKEWEPINVCVMQKIMVEKREIHRAVYKDSDIYLLDDPLSAVDTEVGRHIFERCVCGLLKGKTRILVTHQLQYLKYVDRIVIVKEGRITEVGRYEELRMQGVELTSFLNDGKDMTAKEIDCKEKLAKTDGMKEKVEDEDKEEGDIGISAYWEYIKATKAWFLFPVYLITAIGAEALFLSADVFLVRWTDRASCDFNLSQLNNLNSTWNASYGSYPSNVQEVSCSTINQYGMLYTVMLCTAILAMFVSHQCVGYAIVTAGKTLHENSFPVAMSARMRFFDTNPAGRILNRFSRDIGLMEYALPLQVQNYLLLSWRLLGYLVFICYVNVWMVIPLIPFAVALGMVKRYCGKATNDIKRIESIAKSPVLSHVSDTLVGLQSIRAFHLVSQFKKTFGALQNKHTTAYYTYTAAFRGFGVRCVLAVVIFLNVTTFSCFFLKDDIDGAMIALSLVNIVKMADTFEYIMRTWCELDNHMTSVERIISYTKLETEPPRTSAIPPPEQWPSCGEIQMKDINLRYYSDGPLVLKNISCNINAREKIGIVGRTGAGKSSILSVLFRLAEPTGTIIIDGIDITQIGLHELRSKISVIPQDPILFAGTLRKNLDFQEQYSDEDIWNTLDEVQLKGIIAKLPGQLCCDIAEGGRNFSVGQRQLLCIARTILRQNRILILDEATANVDLQTDELIQATIRRRFKNCTVLTVAHRLETIMDSDRVMVLEDGMLKEFDSSQVLLENEAGAFTKLAEQSGCQLYTHFKGKPETLSGKGGADLGRLAYTDNSIAMDATNDVNSRMQINTVAPEDEANCQTEVTHF